MASIKFDVLIEAVRFAEDGRIDLVRAFERRGATFSDNILINRADLVTRLKSGQKMITGSRKEYLGSTFNTQKVVKLSGDNISTNPTSKTDMLESVPGL